MSITIDQDTDYAELVLFIGEITLGEKNRKSMKDGELRKREAKITAQAVCALLNSGGGVVKARIKNQKYKFTRDGVGLDLEIFLPDILSFPHEYIDFMQHKDYFFIFVKPWKPNRKGPGITTLKTNLYQRNFSLLDELKAGEALQFLEVRKYEERSDSRQSSHVQIIRNELLKECHLLFKRKRLAYEETFRFTKSTHAEVKLTPKEKILESLPQSVSALANTDGGYLFIGLDGKTQKIIGFEAKKSDRVHLKSAIEKHIQQLPVIHFCEKKEKIKYTCKFIKVHKPRSVCSYKVHKPRSVCSYKVYKPRSVCSYKVHKPRSVCSYKVHKPRSVCSYVCALRVERFCCAVFAAEPESWHVEDSRVKNFTTEEWVKRQMDAPAG